ncbi:MAG: hypothetical protein JSU68_12510 [Phycisphaerales bacterium]|nr:MAG: hypothetical protein JSU68_12510 [Phycisphaerales bacterium]
MCRTTEFSGLSPVKARRGFVIGLLSMLALPSGCYNEPAEELGVWSEFLALDVVRTHWAALDRFGADLYLAVGPEELNESLRVFLTDARVAGIEVRPWLQLRDEGIWTNEQNAAAFADYAREFLLWAEENGVPVEWIIIDLEPSLAYAQELRRTAEAEGIFAAVDLLGEHRDAEGFAAAREVLRDMVDEVHRRGFQAMAVTLPWTIDDLGDGDPDVQDMFDTPLAEVSWDRVGVMVYRPFFSDVFGVPLSPGYVARYSESMRFWYPDAAHVAVGNISTAGVMVPPGYTEPLDLALDVSAARSAGIDSISVFSLDGMVLEGGPEAWLAAATGPTLRYGYPDCLTPLVRGAVQVLDALP